MPRVDQTTIADNEDSPVERGHSARDRSWGFDHRRLARNPIAIVGMSGLLPMASNHREYWQNIFAGTDCTAEVPESRWRLDDYYAADPATPDKTYARRGAFVPDVEFDPIEFGLPPNQLGVTSTMQLLSLGVARDLLADAGAPDSDWYDPVRTGVVFGLTGAVPLTHQVAARLSTPQLEEAARSCGLSAEAAAEIAGKFVKAFAPWEENTFPGLLMNVVAGRVANRLGLGGMNCTVDAACAASLAAIRTAIAELVDGRADTMITGGVDTETSIFMYMCFSKVGALSHSDKISPLANAADGTMLGEGLGMVALRRLSDAERDGNRIYAVIRGIGSSSDGRANSIYAPLAAGQRIALERAYADAECSPTSVELFELHATGTAVGDRTELSALGDLLGDSSDEPHVAALGSVKSQIGHTKGTAGTAGLMKLAFALHQKVLPGTINVDEPNGSIDFTKAPYYINTHTRPWILDPKRPRRRAAVSAMGFGGTNFHVVLEEHTSDRTGLRMLHRMPMAYLWHAPDDTRLLELLRDGEPSVDGDIPAGHARVGFVASDVEQADALRWLAIEQFSTAGGADEWSHPRGIFYRRRAMDDLRVGALFAGQGSQYLNMGLEAALNNPVVGRSFDTANRAFANADLRLSQVVFPPPVFDPVLRKRQESDLLRTEYTQPAIGALSAGQYRYLAELGLACSAYSGHSFGELTALWAAGSLSENDYFDLAAARGRAMASAPELDAGTMVAILATRDRVGELLTGFPELVVCNHNTPQQVVVGGATDEVKRLVRECGELKIKARLLPVAAAFHTRYVAHAVDAFRPAVEAVAIGEPTAPVYANSPGASYGADPDANARTLVQQLLEPVEFVDALTKMRAEGVNVFVEFGPKQVLTQFVRQTLGEGVYAIPTDAGPLNDSDVALKRAAVRLAVLGVALSGINRHAQPPLESIVFTGMSVRISAPEYVPEERLAAYEAALNEGPIAELTKTASPASAPEIPAPPAPVVAQPAPKTDLPAARTDVAPATEPIAIAATTAVTIMEDDVNSAVDQYLTLHNQYLDGQLRVAEQLAHVLRQPSEAGVSDTVNAIARQSEAIGRAHARASEILATLAALEAGSGVAPVPAVAVTESRQAWVPPVTPALGNGGGYALAGPASLSAARPAAVTPPPPPTPEPPAPALPQLTQYVSEPVAVSANGSGGAGAADVRASLVGVIAEKTGYPVEMIDPSMDLETDLGIDSIKRVQVFATLRERVPGLPAAGAEQLGELRTVDQAVAFLSEAGGGSPEHNGVEPVAVSANGSGGAGAADVRASLVGVIAEKTGYPVEMIDPSMDLETDLGIDSIKRVQVFATLRERVPGLPAAGAEQLGELRTVDQAVAFLSEAGGGSPEHNGVEPVAVSANGSGGAGAADVRASLVGVIAEKTGYPVEMIDPSMDLETDLGIDSIKRVQVFATLRERVPGLPAAGAEQLGELRTVDQAVAFLSEAGGGSPEHNGVEPVAVSANGSGGAGAADVRASLVGVIAEKTGYPVEMIDPSMDLETDLGIDSIKRVQVFATLRERVPGLPATGAEQLGELRTVDQAVAFLSEAGGVGPKGRDAEVGGVGPKGRDAEVSTPRHIVELTRLPAVDVIEQPYRQDPIAVLFDDGRSDAEALEAGLTSQGWIVRRARHGTDIDQLCTGTVDLYVSLFGVASDWDSAARHLAETILVAKHAATAPAPESGRVGFVTLTRLDGGLGLHGRRGAMPSLIGGVGGVVKTLAAEQHSLFCRSVDVDPGVSDADFVALVMDEIRDAALDTVEVGIDLGGARWTVVPGGHGPAPQVIDISSDDPADDDIELTGGDLLLVTGGARGVTAQCVRALAAHTQARFLLLGRTDLVPEPDWAAGVADADLQRAAIAALSSSGAKPTPPAVRRAQSDVIAGREIRDTLSALGERGTYLAVDISDAAAVVAALSEYRGLITGVVHGAGVLADAMLAKKTIEQIEKVFSPKLTGLRHVLDAVDAAALRHLILFTSVAGLLGNPGQADYAAANEALCRFAAGWKHAHPDTRVTAIDWAAWDGGMVTDDLRDLFAARNIPLLDMEVGARAFVEQFTEPRADDVCVLVGASAALGGLRTAPVPAFTALRDIGDIADDPVMRAHRVGGNVVLPATFGLGWLISVVERAYPEHYVVEAGDFQVHKGIVFDGSPRGGHRVHVDAGVEKGGRIVVRAAVRGETEAGKPIPHYAATLSLAAAPAPQPVLEVPPLVDGPADGLQIYREATLFHGPPLQGIRRVLDRSSEHAVLECRLVDANVADRAYNGRLHSPVLADLLLQGAAVLSKELLNEAALPLGIGRAEWFAPLPDDEPFILLLDDVRRRSATVTVCATAMTTSGLVLQQFNDIVLVSTKDMTEMFRESVRHWLSADDLQDVK